MTKQGIMFQMKAQDKTPEKLLNEVVGFPEKKNQNSDNKDDPWSQKNNGEDAGDVYLRPRRNKEETQRD